MRTIAIINQKGGCGKTTTSINLAAVLAGQGRKTLLVDMDPQSHCALGLAVPEQQLDKTIADVLRAGMDGTLAFGDIIWQISHNLDLAPSNIGLAAIEQELAVAPDKDRRLTQVLATVSDQYEFCIIDCPPSIGLLTFNALRAAREVIVPVETGYFSMQGAVRQQQTIEMLARRISHQVRFKVLATMYDVRTKLAREILGELRRHFGDKLLPMVVHFNSKLKEAASFGQAITEYDPNSTGYQDFEQLSHWLFENPPVEVDPTLAASLTTQAQAPSAAGNNPAVSRAAELVERARALAARTAALSARLTPGNTPGSSPTPGNSFSAGPQGPGFSTPAPAPVEAVETKEELEEAGTSLPFVAPVNRGRDANPTPTAPRHDASTSPAIPFPAPASESAPALTPARAPKAAPDALRPAAAAGAAATAVATTSVAAQTTTDRLADMARVIETQRILVEQPTETPELSAETSSAGESETAEEPKLVDQISKLYGARATSQGILFLQPLGQAQTMGVAGDFNNWNPASTPLQRHQRLGVWQACVPVPPGRYRYRLVIDGKWVQDPYNSYVESNPFGELNNIVEFKES